MPSSLAEACKKRKRNPKLFSFHSFCDPDCTVISSESFRDRIRIFLRDCADIEDYNIRAMPVWCTLLVQGNKGGRFVPLYTIEETVRNSDQPYCDHCRCCGWSHHFVSRRRYHIIIPADDEWRRPLNEDALEIQNHLLHGMIHSNGFGHLLGVNGIEGGSKHLYGREIMDLWDRICTNLRTRMITLEDESQKKSMQLRLLHGVAYGHPWFGKWGYRFCSGSFGVEEHHYSRAIEFLSSMYLDDLIANFKNKKSSQDISQLVRCYRDMSETQLSTLQELLRFMLTVKSRAPRIKVTMAKSEASSVASVALQPMKPYGTRTCPQVKMCPKEKEKSGKCRKFASLIASLDSRWPTRRLEYAANVIVGALKEKRESDPLHNGMTRQEVRDAARQHIGDTGLLDYVLKSMTNVIVGNYKVRRAINPTNRILEYTIEENVDGGGSTEPELEVAEPPQIPKCVAPFPYVMPPGVDIYGDIIWVYKNILLGFPETDSAGLAARVILDSKHFVKEWPMRDEDDQMLRFLCKALSASIELDMDLDLDKRSGPGELIAVPLHATIAELKEMAGQALRDTYCLTEKFVVTEVESLEGLADDELVFGVLESGSEIRVRGVGLDWRPELRHEGGPENWVVKCECGARDDDGERMVSCDLCEIWQHTRCIGIKDSEAAPALYLCQKCCFSFAPERVEPSFEMDNCTDAYMLPLEEDFGMQLNY